MVAHHEVAFLGYDDLRHRAAVAILLRDVTLAQRLAIEPDLAVIDTQSVAGESDDALDIAFFRIAGIVEDDDIAALDGLEAIDEFVDEEAVAILKARQHAGAFYADGLVEEGDDQDGGRSGNQQIAHPKNHARAFAGRRDKIWLDGVRFRVAGFVCGRLGM